MSTRAALNVAYACVVDGKTPEWIAEFDETLLSRQARADLSRQRRLEQYRDELAGVA